MVSGEKLSKKKLIDKLKFELEEAVNDERFEDAIVLRDKIKELGSKISVARNKWKRGVIFVKKFEKKKLLSGEQKNTI